MNNAQIGTLLHYILDHPQTAPFVLPSLIGIQVDQEEREVVLLLMNTQFMSLHGAVSQGTSRGVVKGKEVVDSRQDGTRTGGSDEGKEGFLVMSDLLSK